MLVKSIGAVFSLTITITALSQNVGIGTASPQVKLHLVAAGEVLRIQGATPWIGFMNNTDPGYRGFIYYPDTALVMGSIAGSNQHLVLAPNNIGLLYAHAQQRIGIGTGNPLSRLHVVTSSNVLENEAIRIDGPHTPFMSFYDNNIHKGYLQAALGGFEIGSKSAQSINFYTNDQQRFTILNNGNIGINETNPNRLVVVKGSHPNSVSEVYNTSSVNGAALIASINNALPSGVALTGGKAIVGLSTNFDVGVWGSNTGNGWGVYGTSSSGLGGYFSVSSGGIGLISESRSVTANAAQFSSFDLGGNPIKTKVVFVNTAPSTGSSAFPFAFQVTATGTPSIMIPNTGHASNATDLLYVQHKLVANPVSIPVNVIWTGANWFINSENGANIPAGEIFNVMVVKQ